MRTLLDYSRQQSIKLQPKRGTTGHSRVISFSNLLPRAIYPVTIAQGPKRPKIWIGEPSNGLLMNPGHTGLDRLAYTCLGNRSFIQGSLMLVPTSKDLARLILYCLPQMEPYSKNTVNILTTWELIKLSGRTKPVKLSRRRPNHGKTSR